MPAPRRAPGPRGKAPGKGKNQRTMLLVGGAAIAGILILWKVSGGGSGAAAGTGYGAGGGGSYPVAGPAGSPGSTGPAGPAGAKGATGATGKTGPRGTSGTTRHTQRLAHAGNLLQIANRNGIGLDQLLQLNPQLSRYKGTRHVLPAGTVVTI